MFTMFCKRCSQTTVPIYKTRGQLPLEGTIQPGFFCQHCRHGEGRFDSDVVLKDLITRFNEMEQRLSNAEGSTYKDGTPPPEGHPQPVGH